MIYKVSFLLLFFLSGCSKKISTTEALTFTNDELKNELEEVIRDRNFDSGLFYLQYSRNKDTTIYTIGEISHPIMLMSDSIMPIHSISKLNDNALLFISFDKSNSFVHLDNEKAMSIIKAYFPKEYKYYVKEGVFSVPDIDDSKNMTRLEFIDDKLIRKYKVLY